MMETSHRAGAIQLKGEIEPTSDIVRAKVARLIKRKEDDETERVARAKAAALKKVATAATKKAAAEKKAVKEAEKKAAGEKKPSRASKKPKPGSKADIELKAQGGARPDRRAQSARARTCGAPRTRRRRRRRRRAG